MTSVLSQLPLSYAVLLEHRSYGSASAVHEPNPTGRPAAPRVRLHLKPGQKGTKQLLAQYGDRLICVRYRYDAQRKKRFKTVELLIAERDWEPPPPHFGHDQIVGLRVAFADMAVRDRVKQAGGTRSGLPNRIVDESASNSRCLGSSRENLQQMPLRHSGKDARIHCWMPAPRGR